VGRNGRGDDPRAGRDTLGARHAAARAGRAEGRCEKVINLVISDHDTHA
jgi:hypothetical protein